ncbi:MAG: pyrimidine 5'-nucleotidase [Sphingomonas sp.]|uniref:pyrimidine 5'-nucleotidase n=1 Tax=Sphingomonas sp. TaxID=28214 RepID=UPI00120064B9|nr:pyrimidine 5'-nucleotidase [Sphingomonas sp.]THD37269.1 MAG: pyrimidine 5'-nucleotidase [Sphingomonas sp.]
MLARLAHIRNWLFDLDNTLYPHGARLFVQVDRRITGYIARFFDVDHDEAYRIQKNYFHTRGTTLAGLMAEHGVDPHEYLADVHDIEMDMLEENAPLAAAIAKLPGRKLIFTNADEAYARRILAQLGLGDSFEAIHDVHALDYRPKPEPSAYRHICDAYGLDPTECLFADDMARNLKPAKDLGMTTLWVDNGSEQAESAERDHVDFATRDITHWLHEILEEA